MKNMWYTIHIEIKAKTDLISICNEKGEIMANSRRNYICVTASGKVKKYASQSIGQIIDEKEEYSDQFISVTSIGLHSEFDKDYEILEWHD